MSTKEKRPGAQHKTQVKVTRRRRRESDVVYTPAQHFDKYKFLLRMVTVVAVVLAVVLGMAIFFKVEVVNVSGAEKYTPWDIRQASGIQEGENLMTLNRAKVGGRILTALPYVESAKVSIKLPDTVNIEITELTVVYALEDTAGAWWLMDAEGVVVDTTTGTAAQSYTRIQGVQIEPPTVGQPATAAQPVVHTSAPTEESADPSEQIPVTEPLPVPTGEKLSTALAILNSLERNGVIGKVTVVDVADSFDLQLWYQDRYQVYLGDDSRMDYKISAMKGAVEQMTDYQRGQLDVSFTQWPDKVGYTPFEQESY